MVKKLIVANWKMNPQTVKEADLVFKGSCKAAQGVKTADVVICPPFPFLYLGKKIPQKNVFLGAQDMFSEKEGAYTGRVSAGMLCDAKVRYVIIGHSEKRTDGDTNNIVNTKIRATLKAKITPIICVGELTRDTHGEYLSFIKQQLHESLAGLAKAQIKSIVIAYEPLWAIGASALREATPEEFVEIKIFIKKVISDMYDAKTAHAVPILYGGSVHPENARSFLVEGQASGFLVGRDSLTPLKFAKIIAATI